MLFFLLSTHQPSELTVYLLSVATSYGALLPILSFDVTSSKTAFTRKRYYFAEDPHKQHSNFITLTYWFFISYLLYI